MTTLLLDVDGVLQFLRPEFDAEMERAYPWRHSYAAFLHDLHSDPAEARTLVGDGDVRELTRRILPRHCDELTPDEFVNLWLVGETRLNEELLDLIPGLDVDEVHLLTNQDPVRGRFVAARYGDRPWLTGIVASYEVGHVKPERAFFDKAISRIGGDRRECLFVDDKFRFVQGAEDAGIPSLHFRDNDTLIADLTGRGLRRTG